MLVTAGEYHTMKAAVLALRRIMVGDSLRTAAGVFPAPTDAIVLLKEFNDLDGTGKDALPLDAEDAVVENGTGGSLAHGDDETQG